MGVWVYLKSTGLFSILQQNSIVVDDRGIGVGQASQLILPLTRLDFERDVEKATNDAHEALSNSGLGSANLNPLVSEVFAELAMNAVQHAESPIGSYGMVQFYESEIGHRFVCSAADGGIGIRRSLTRNPEFADNVACDWTAIELATKERVSGLPDRRRGIGLYGVAEDMKMPGRHLIIHSGIGSLQISEELGSSAERIDYFLELLSTLQSLREVNWNMKSVMIHDLLNMRVLVTRETARSIEPKVAAALTEGDGDVILDFAGVEGISPSFLDETLSVIEDCSPAVEQGHIHVAVKNPPTILSEKFAAVARGHDLQINASEIGDWIISRNGDITNAK